MADKILQIKVDPCCPCSFKKIKKILCKLQACFNIKTITYDEANYTVKLSGPFDPQKLSRMILCKACKLIIEIKVVDPPKPPPPPPPKKTINKVCNDIEIIIRDKDSKCTKTKKVIKQCIPEKEKDCKEEKKDCTIQKVCNAIKIIVEDECPDPCRPHHCPPPPCRPHPCPPPPCPPPPCPPPPCPRPCSPPPCPRPCSPPKHCPKPPCPPPCKPPVCQVCCWIGGSVGYPGGSSCHGCGRIYGCGPDGPPMGHHGPPHGGCQFPCEQEQSCTMM